MKRTLSVLILLMALALPTYAVEVNSIMDKVVLEYTKSKRINADFTITSSQINTSGSIVMDGKMFRILTSDYKCWYDGKTQWIYTSLTGEVNIIEPTDNELETANPYLAVVSYKKLYNASLKSQTSTDYVVNLTSKLKTSDIKSLQIVVNKKTYNISKAVAVLSDGSTQTIVFTNYRKNVNISGRTFVFNKTMVPAGTEIVDLR